jgi:hypothetical protein
MQRVPAVSGADVELGLTACFVDLGVQSHCVVLTFGVADRYFSRR